MGYALLSVCCPLVRSFCGCGHFMCLYCKVDPFVLIFIVTYGETDVFCIVLNALLMGDVEVGDSYLFESTLCL